ncbi:hypothetical protein SNK12g_23720 [Lactiplantibacillus plantarum]|nr:putative phosphoglycerate mutase (putative) [Lactiplantibacillus plantarum]
MFEGESEVLNPKPDPVRRSHGNLFCQYGGESDLQVQLRVVKALTTIMERPDNQQVLAVSHGGASFMFLRRWLSMDAIEQRGIVLTNCVVLKFEYAAGEFKFQKIINLATMELLKNKIMSTSIGSSELGLACFGRKKAFNQSNSITGWG